MAGSLNKDWPVYVLLGLVVFFFIYIVISGRIQEKKENEDKQKNKK